MYNATAVCHFGDLTEPMEKSVELDGIGWSHLALFREANGRPTQ